MTETVGKPRISWRLALSGLAVFLVVYRDLLVLVRHDVGESWDWLHHHPGFAFAAWSTIALLGAFQADRERRILRTDFTRQGSVVGWFALALAIAGLLSVVAGGHLFLRSPHRSDGYYDSAAVANLRTIAVGQQEYLSRKGRYGDINELVAAGLLDSRFEQSDIVGGYHFEVGRPARGYQATARTVSLYTGVHDYTVTEEGVVRFSTDTDRAPTGLAGRPVL